MQEELKVRFIGEAEGIEAASDKAVASLNKVGGASIKNSQTIIQSSAKSTQGVVKLSQSIETLRAKMEARKQFLITETDISKIAAYNREIKSLEGQIGKIQNIGVGDSGLGQLGKGATTAFSSIRKLAYLIPGIGVAGLIGQFSELAIEMAKGGLTVDSIASKLGILSKKAVDAKAVMSGFGDIFQEAAKKSGEDIVKLEVFRQKLNDVNIPASERLKILKEYNATADATNRIDETQINNLGLINQKIGEQNTLILKRALATATLGKVNEEANKLIESELKLQEELSRRGFKDLDDYIKKTKEANDAKAKAFTVNPNLFKDQQSADSLDKVRKGLDGVVNPALKAAGAFKSDESAFKSLVDTVQTGRDDLQKLIGSLSGLLTVPGLTTEKNQDKTPKGQKFDFLFDFLPFDPSGKLKPEQKAQLESSIDKFQKEFRGILKGVDFDVKAKSQDEKIKLALEFDAKLKAGKVEIDVKSITDAINKTFKPEDLLPNGLDFSGALKSLEDSQKTAIEQFLRGAKDESERLAKENVFNLPLSFNLSTDIPAQIDLFKTKLKQLGAAIPKTIEGIDIFGNPIELKLEDLIDTSKISNKDALDAIRKAFEGIKTQVLSYKDQLNSTINTFVQGIETEGFSAIGEGIAAALTGSDIGNVFKQFGQMLGGAVQALGKQIIALSTAALLAKKAVKSLFTNPVVGIAAGIALVAVGTALKNLLSGGIRGFAKGGLVPGTGNGDTVPAMLTPGEFVVTKDKAPLAAKLFGSGSPRNIGGIMGYAQGGLVSAVDNSSNSAIGRIEQVPYIAGFDISHDKVRLMINRANNYGNNFGR